MITKLKYVGVKVEDLLDVYKLYIRSIAEYCSPVFHSTLTVEQSNTLERIQNTSLKIILWEMHIDNSASLEMSDLEDLQKGKKNDVWILLLCVQNMKS